MMLSESIVDEERVRLPYRSEPVSQATGFDELTGFFFGFVFVAAGVAFILMGLKAVPVDPLRIYDSNWVVTSFGGIFTMGGILVWIRVLKEQLLINRRKTLSALHPRSEVFADYPWNPQGITKSPWSKVFKSLVGTLVFAGLLTPFNWWTLGEGGFFAYLVFLFDLILFLAVFELFRRILAALKYGTSSIEYETFPFTTGDRVSLRWSMPSGLKNAKSITFVLRCVEEWTEIEDDTTWLVHEQLWAATRRTESRLADLPNASLSLSFDVPESAPGSYLSGESRITFWELEVCATAPGVDFEERYLVPVYRDASS